jgi:ParB family chromosome partitioning protein
MIEHQSQSIPLSRLSISTDNVRQSARTGIDTLANSILAQGVLQSLVVTKHDKAADGYAIVAGGRRFAALQALLKKGKIKANFPVPCTVIDGEGAVAASLAENVQRQDMGAADQFEAFKKLVDGGKSVEDVAALFGVTPLVVRRRLKLANIAPTLIERFRKEEFDLEALMAFAVTDDHERQEQAWNSLPKQQRSAWQIRQALAQEELASDDRLVRFVGLKAYQKAGGAIRTDLFSDDEDAYVQDVPLVRSLAQAKLEKRAEQIRDEEGAAWCEARLQSDFSDRQAFGTIPMMRKEPSAKQAAQLAKLRAQIAALEAVEDQDDDDGETSDERHDQIQDLQERIEDIGQTLERPDPRGAKLAGVLVTLDYHGKVEIHRGLIRPADKKALKALPKAEGASEGARAAGGGDEDESASLSGALRMNLSAHLTAGLQARLDASPGVALRALAAALWGTVAADSHLSVIECPVKLRDIPPNLENHGPDVLAGTAAQAWKASRREWTDKLKKVGDVFAWLLTKDDAEVIALLAHCTAHATDSTGMNGASEQTLALASACKLDMRDYWQPTAEGFLKRVPKSVVLDALREVDASLDFGPFERAKKAELCAMAEPILVRAKWLPPMLRVVGRKQ